MAKTSDWMPNSRSAQLAAARMWLDVLREETEDASGKTVQKYAAWGIPAEVFTELTLLYASAQESLTAAQNEETRTKVTNQRCKDAFNALAAAMRNCKRRYFFMPPLGKADYVSLGLSLPDTSPTQIVRPEGMVTAEFRLTTIHQLVLIIRPVSGSLLDSKSDYGVRAYWGIMPPGGATLEEAAGTRHYLMKPPVSGEGLPESKFTRRKKEVIDFLPEDSGKTAYFCLRYENSKGEAGPWGPIVSSVIP